MFEKIKIENYKSIEILTLDLGRVNVFIGENGAGKSNILEAVALAGAAQANKLDNEFLTSRGIRVSDAKLMRSAFSAETCNLPIKITANLKDGASIVHELSNDNRPYSSWKQISSRDIPTDFKEVTKWLTKYLSSEVSDEDKMEVIKAFQESFNEAFGEQKKDTDRPNKGIQVRVELPESAHSYLPEAGGIENFIIYSPENSALRTFDKEGQIEPLGINGEGLIKFLEVISKDRNKESITLIKETLRLFGWFEDFRITKKKVRNKIELLDLYLDEKSPKLDQRSTNEGFLFVAFYVSLFVSKLTPKFFAIDNIDSSLNPRLCQELMRKLVNLAKANDKQVLLTSHNPAMLDGLDINDPEQKLFIVSRDLSGKTKIRPFEAKPQSDAPLRLSHMFINGMLGGLPKGF